MALLDAFKLSLVAWMQKQRPKSPAKEQHLNSASGGMVIFAKRSVKSKFNSFHSTLYKIPWLFCRVCFLAECSLHNRKDTAKYSSVSNPSSLTHGQAIADISQHRSGGVLFQAGVL